MSHDVTGISFDLSEEQEALRAHIRSFVAEEITPVALEFDESQEFPHEIFRKLGISEQTFYRWKKRFAGLGIAELRRLRTLEEENSKLKQLVADLSLDKKMLQDVLSKKL